MARILILLQIIVTLGVIWKAYIAPVVNRGSITKLTSRWAKKHEPPQVTGPDDDPEFLEKLDKENYKRNKDQEN